MNVSEDLPGLFSGGLRDDGYSWADLIFIYYDEFQRLSFNFLLDLEHNHGWDRTFDEGFVSVVQETTGCMVHFETRQRYYFDGVGPRDFVTMQPQQSVRILRVLDQAEIDTAREEGDISLETTMAFFEPDEDLFYQRANDKVPSQRENAKSLEKLMVKRRSDLHNRWQEQAAIRAKLMTGISPEEVAQHSGWSVKDLEAFMKRVNRRDYY